MALLLREDGFLEVVSAGVKGYRITLGPHFARVQDISLCLIYNKSFGYTYT